MRKIVLIIIIMMIMIIPINASYCVIDEAGQIIADNDMHHTQSVASISKIMSAIIAIENGNLDDEIVVGDEINLVDGSMIYIKKGDKITLRDLLYGLMLRSGNDAAMVIAKHIGKDIDNFVKMMNDKALELHMYDTKFNNPSGLDEKDGGNISSAYDMALLMSYCIKNEEFVKIAGSKYYTSELNYYWKNKNKLLFEYDKAIGGKTGFTKKARRTLVSAARDNDQTSIVVTLNESDDFKLHEQLHEKYFNQYQSVVVLKKGKYHLGEYYLDIKDDISLSIKNNDEKKIEVFSYVKNQKYHVEVKYGKYQKHYIYDINKGGKS